MLELVDARLAERVEALERSRRAEDLVAERARHDVLQLLAAAVRRRHDVVVVVSSCLYANDTHAMCQLLSVHVIPDYQQLLSTYVHKEDMFKSLHG